MDPAQSSKRQYITFDRLRLNSGKTVEIALFEVLEPETPQPFADLMDRERPPSALFLFLIDMLRALGMVQYRFSCNAYLLMPVTRLPFPPSITEYFSQEGITNVGNLIERWPDFLRICERHQIPVNRLERWLWARGLHPGTALQPWVRENLTAINESFSDVLFSLPRPTWQQLFPSWEYLGSRANGARPPWAPPPLSEDLYPVLTLPPMPPEDLLQAEPEPMHGDLEPLRGLGGLLNLQPTSWRPAENAK